MGELTIGTDIYDIYGSLTGLASYANGSFTFAAVYADALAADADSPARALVEATRMLVLQPWEDTANADVDTAEAAVVTAAYELALAALADPAVFATTSTEKLVKRVDAKGASVEFFAPTAGARFPARVMELIGGLLASASSSEIAGGAYASGIDGESQFDDCDEYGLSGA